MGKKAKSKGKTPRKLPAASSPRSNTHTTRVGRPADASDPCEHYLNAGAAATRVLLELRSDSEDAGCEDCRDELGGKTDGKGKGHKGGARKKVGPVHSKHVSTAPVIIWVCLECAHFGCAGDADISKPYGHTRRHHKQSKHAFAARLDDPTLCWCFSCDSLIRIQVPVDAGSEPTAVKDGGESVNGQEVVGGKEGGSLEVDAGKGYAVRGLVNLGNTCFFNSVMQNLFAMDMMRGYFSTLDVTLGPLSMALKKLYAETGSGSGSCKGIVNPKNFLGCICAKAPQFKGYLQQDSHELLRYLLDGLSMEDASSRKLLPSGDEGKSSPQSPATFVDGIFGGQISSTICCVECGHTSVVYEPFLDLSLPLPSKKVPPKKVATQSKKAKFPPSLRGRRARERASVRLHGLDQLKEENNNSASSSGDQNMGDPASSESLPSASTSTPVNEQDEITFFGGGDETNMESSWQASRASDETWLDFVETVPQAPNDSAIKDAEDMGVYQSRDDGLEMNPMQEPEMLEESSWEKEEAEIIQLPEKEAVSDMVEESTGESENMRNVVSVDNPINIPSVAPSSSSGCGASEVGLDSIVDLFAEPEVMSGPSTQMDTSEAEEPEAFWFSGTGSESNEEIIDNADTPVSVETCLAYFTKPELLSGEHAWFCGNCCKILQQGKQNTRQKTVKREEVADEIKEMDNGVSLSCGSVDSSHQASENGKLANSVEQRVYAFDRYEDAEGNGSKKSLDITEPFCMIETVCHNGNCLELPSPEDCQDNLRNVPFENSDVADSGTSKYYSCSSSIDKAEGQVSSNPDGDSCCNTNLSDDAFTAHTLVSRSMEDTSPGISDKVKYKDSQKVRKKAMKHSAKVNNDDESEPENMKRDATKRILVHKSPHILTIHLKRFGQDARGRLNKLSGHVSFQEMLDLAPYLDRSCQGNQNHCYRLVGLVEHSGNMRSGHYIAYVRGQRGKGKVNDDGISTTWFHASDAYVREASLEEVLRSEAYILFYERVQL